MFTVIFNHSNGCTTTIPNVRSLLCDDLGVVINYRQDDGIVLTRSYDLGYDPKHSEVTITGFRMVA